MKDTINQTEINQEPLFQDLYEAGTIEIELLQIENGKLRFENTALKQSNIFLGKKMMEKTAEYEEKFNTQLEVMGNQQVTIKEKNESISKLEQLLEKSLNGIEEQKKQHEREIKELKKTIKGQNEQHEREIKELKETIKGQNEQHEREIKELKETIKEQKEQYEREMNRKDEQIKTQDKEIKEQSEQISKQNEQINILQTELSSTISNEISFQKFMNMPMGIHKSITATCATVMAIGGGAVGGTLGAATGGFIGRINGAQGVAKGSAIGGKTGWVLGAGIGMNTGIAMCLTLTPSEKENTNQLSK